MNLTIRNRNKGTSKPPNWQYIVSYQVGGKWKQKSKQGFKGKKDCQLAGNQMMAEISKLTPTANGSMTFKEVFDAMMADKTLTPNSVETYINAFKSYGEIQEMEVSSIKYQDIAPIIREAEKTRKHAGVKSLLAIGRMTINYAIKKLKIIHTNPFSDVEIKAPKKSDAIKRVALNPSEIASVLSNLQGDVKLMCAFIGLAGLRISEARGLTSKDIDLKSREIRIDKQMHNDGRVGPLKSKNSYRTVPMSESLYKIYTENPIRIGSIYSELVLTDRVNRRLKPFGIRSHDLRHSYATNLISHGIDFKTTAYLLGDDVKMIMDTYAHVNSDMLASAKKIIESF